MNEERAKAGNGAKPLVMAYDRQAEVNEIVKKAAEKATKTGKFEHTYAVKDGYGENLNATYLGTDASGVSSAKMAASLLTAFKTAIASEKNYYYTVDSSVRTANAHYHQIIDPKCTKVCIGSTAVTINGKAYVVEYQEFWK